MEAARLRDETASQMPPPQPQAMPADEPLLARKIAAAAASRPRVMETLICSGTGTVLYEAKCPDAQARVQFMRQIAQEATSLGQLLPLGTFDTLEVQWSAGCEVTQVRPKHMAYVRVALNTGQNPPSRSP